MCLVCAISEYLLDALTKLEPNQTNGTFKNVIGKAVANVTNQIVYGRRLEYDDDVMLSLTKFDAYYMKAIKAGLIPGYKVLSRVSLVCYILYSPGCSVFTPQSNVKTKESTRI